MFSLKTAFNKKDRALHTALTTKKDRNPLKKALNKKDRSPSKNPSSRKPCKALPLRTEDVTCDSLRANSYTEGICQSSEQAGVLSFLVRPF